MKQSSSRFLLAILLGLPAIGCVSRAGPFVTNVAYTPDGRLLVDRCYAEYDDFGKNLSNQDCTREIVAAPRPVAPPPPR